MSNKTKFTLVNGGMVFMLRTFAYFNGGKSSTNAKRPAMNRKVAGTVGICRNKKTFNRMFNLGYRPNNSL